MFEFILIISYILITINSTFTKFNNVVIKIYFFEFLLWSIQIHVPAFFNVHKTYNHFSCSISEIKIPSLRKKRFETILH